ncbi:unnamed protein product [Arabidopsis halleri]
MLIHDALASNAFEMFLPPLRYHLTFVFFRPWDCCFWSLVL